MLAMLKSAKEAVERIGGCRIYRNSLPHGVDCFFDIGRRLGRDGIKVVFDVGANVGQSALSYLHEFPQAEIFSLNRWRPLSRNLLLRPVSFPESIRTTSAWGGKLARRSST